VRPACRQAGHAAYRTEPAILADLEVWATAAAPRSARIIGGVFIFFCTIIPNNLINPNNFGLMVDGFGTV
jgi:hypothetical protein